MIRMIRVAGAVMLTALAVAAPGAAIAQGAARANAPVTIDLRGLRAGTGDLYVSLQTR